ncbi:MAG TPA: hypothetical protein VEC94_08705 [Pseudolabrys sp.]|nr:hypothetical protein [Pseudolabrys sp.]
MDCAEQSRVAALSEGKRSRIIASLSKDDGNSSRRRKTNYHRRAFTGNFATGFAVDKNRKCTEADTNKRTFVARTSAGGDRSKKANRAATQCHPSCLSIRFYGPLHGRAARRGRSVAVSAEKFHFAVGRMS